MHQPQQLQEKNTLLQRMKLPEAIFPVLMLSFHIRIPTLLSGHLQAQPVSQWFFASLVMILSRYAIEKMAPQSNWPFQRLKG